ncbi:DUF1996 domain-containing protein [Catenuloplanes atrovinosus]|uniref:DUF1996 domain-containing protein n=1 Tax=Catenuloplanes atrovinosus TaxID=137266 RepID=A0AAE3YIG9_9ACTN|nr:DUF1996 domain-containing protein [Catenuloplanes atrovinosus]MDR7274100.1 hypothetical protein [Catenuloplanes atrovinosus]
MRTDRLSRLVPVVALVLAASACSVTTVPTADGSSAPALVLPTCLPAEYADLATPAERAGVTMPPCAPATGAPSPAGTPAGAPPSASPSPSPSRTGGGGAAPTVTTPVTVPTFDGPPPRAQYREVAANCTMTHRRGDDPIVFPGLTGASHDHTFVGNPATDAFSTPEKLVGGKTSCQDPKDASSYWFPTLLQNGKALTPQQVTVYYKSGIDDYRRVRPFPAGFRLLVGNAKAPAGETFQGTWSCGGQTGPEIPASCPDGSSLIVRHKAPSCWDGKHLDTPDHKSHMAWPVRGECPRSHPVPLPMFEMKVPYKLPGGVTKGLALSSGAANTFHFDFMNGWDPARQAEVIAHCVNGGRQCNGVGYDQHKP